jgi:hypothetical protein
MHDEDLKLIRQIVASDGRKYTAGNIDRSRYDRLVDMGWLTPFKTNISEAEGEGEIGQQHCCCLVSCQATTAPQAR